MRFTRLLLISLTAFSLIVTSCGGGGGSAGAALPAGATVIAPSFFGMHAGCIGIGLPINCKRRGDGWPTIPFGTYRVWDTRTAWANLEPKRGAFRFGPLDKRIDAVRQHNESVLMVLSGTPSWATSYKVKNYIGVGAAGNPDSLNDWRTFVDTVVTRYRGRVDAYQIWNEASLTMYWDGSPAQMALMTRTAAAEIRRIDPKATIVGPSVVIRDNNAMSWTGSYLAAGAGSSFDVFAIHQHPKYHESPELAFKRVGAMRDLLARYGVHKPIWDTELTLGLTSKFFKKQYELFTGATAQSQLVRTMLLSLMWDTPRTYWYAWDDSNFGGLFLRQFKANQPTEAAAAWTTLYNWLVGSWYRGCAATGTVYTCNVQYAAAQGVIKWTTAGPVQQRLTGKVSCAAHIDGSTNDVSAGQTLALSDSPVLIVSKSAKIRGLAKAPC